MLGLYTLHASCLLLRWDSTSQASCAVEYISWELRSCFVGIKR